MQISTIKNQNLEKPSRNPFWDHSEDFEKQIFWISLKKNLVPRMLSHRANVKLRNSGENRRKLSKFFF